MQDLISKISIQTDNKTYLKDPESSELGKRIIARSIDLIDDLGFESFTFRKLGEAIKSPEASIYRYFESKHQLLLYFTSWYWGWMEYRLAFSLANVDSAEVRLERAIDLLTKQVTEDGSFSHINEVKLNHLVIAESSKTYLTKEVDEENKHGVFRSYKQLVARVSEIILEINRQYEYPHMLVTTMIEGAHHQRFFAEHLPGLTDKVKDRDSVTTFFKEMVFNAIKSSK
jgi:AcrR family transcriptional regulator